MEFNIGQEYIRPGLFGPSFWVRCMERTEDTATFAQVGYEDDPDWVMLELKRDGDAEVCECWEYRGHHGYIRADNRF